MYAALGFTSLFGYCTTVLRLSEDAACTRIAVAVACRRFPVILDHLASGASNLTNIRRLAGKLTPENHQRVLARALHESRDEVEKLLRELDPLPDVPSSVRKAPPGPQPAFAVSEAPAAPVAASPHVRPSVRPLAPQRYHVNLTIGEKTRETLRRAQTLMRREVPDGDLEPILARALDLLVADLERTMFGRTSRTGPGRPIRPGTDKAGTPRVTFQATSSARCRSVTATGARSSRPTAAAATRAPNLEFHHVRPFAHDGPATVENIALRCRRHNQYEAELAFGAGGASRVEEAAVPCGDAA